MNIDTSTEVKIGPSAWFGASIVLMNPASYALALVAAFSFVPAVRTLIYHMFASQEGDVREALVWYYYFQKEHPVGLIALGLLSLIIGYAAARQMSTCYRLRGSFLYVSYGIFTRDINTVSQQLVFDCDISKNPFQVLFGTGNLHIRTVDRQSVTLRFIESPERWRDVIMAKSAVDGTRILGSI